MRVLRSFAATAGLACVAGLLAAGSSTASIPHPDVVSEDPEGYTPHLVQRAGDAQPRALTIAQSGDTMIVGGRFEAVEDPARTTTTSRHNIFAFSASTGALDAGFQPQLDGEVHALLAVGGSVYIGGNFRTVDGIQRPGIAKLDATTGALDTTFRPRMRGALVSELRLVAGRLVVAGNFASKLAALDPATGVDTGYIDLAIEGKLPGSAGKAEVLRFAVKTSGTRLVAVGNFSTVDGQPRPRAFMLNLGATSATLSRWYYPPLSDKCRSNSGGRQAYLRDVDFSANGKYFVFVSTGFVPEFNSQIGTHLCDVAARFETFELAPSEPTWINYTGGDTLHSVSVTGAAVYVQGHNRWLDNPRGRDFAGPGAVSRPGLGAIDPVTGMALPWNPRKPARQGGQDFLSTPDGLWVVSDSRRFNGEYHRGIAFAPLP